MSRFLLLATSILFSLALCEVAIRVLDLGPEIATVEAGAFQLSSNPILRYELRPGSYGRGKPINEDGMADRPFPLRKPRGTFRIAVIGDSITHGYRVKMHQTYPKMLERLLQKYVGGGTRFEVLNFGVVGYSVPQIVENLRAKALRYEPDLVIYGYCLNDPELYNPFARMLRAKLEGHERGYLDHLAGGRLRLYALARFLVESYRLQADEGPDEEAIWSEDPGHRAFHSGALAYERYVTGLHDREEAWGVVTSGLDDLGAVARDEEVPVAVAVFPLMRPHQPYTLGPVHRKVVRAVEQRGLRALDLSAVFAAARSDSELSADLSVDRVHPSATGNGISALAILYWLLDNELVPGAETADLDRLKAEVPGARLVRSATAYAEPARPGSLDL